MSSQNLPFTPGQVAWVHYSRSRTDSVRVEIVKHDGLWLTVRPNPRRGDQPSELLLSAVTLRVSGNGLGRLSHVQDPAAEPVLGRHDGSTGAPLILPEVSKPLTCAELCAITDSGRFQIDVVVPIDHDIESMNDFVSEAITGSCADLVSIEYRPYLPQGVAAEASGHLYVRVIADWGPTDEDDVEALVAQLEAAGA
jgi:hypothetical protein